MSIQNRVLIVGMTHEVGGMENYIINLYRHIDRDLIQFDFVNDQPGNSLPFQDEFEALGGRIFDLPLIRDGGLNHYMSLYRIFRSTAFRAVYYNASWKIRNTDVFQFAVRYNVPIRILHSHSISKETTVSGIQLLREKISDKKKERLITHRFACSSAAGEWMFGSKPFRVVPNGIDSEKFCFNDVLRKKIRTENNLDNKVVYGTVARLYKVKNPLFLIDVFFEIHQLQPNSVFWHVGGGDLELEMREKINRLGLQNSYFLLGRKENVQDYLNAMDVFIFPSLFEGFGISLLEAQSAGLKCLASDSIPAEVNVTGNVSFCSLKQSPRFWAESAVGMSSYHRTSGNYQLLQAHYDIRQTSNDFQKFIITGN